MALIHRVGVEVEGGGFNPHIPSSIDILQITFFLLVLVLSLDHSGLEITSDSRLELDPSNV